MLKRADDCYSRDENDPLNGKNAQHIQSGDIVEVFMTFRYESGRVALVGSKVKGSFNPTDFVSGDVGEFNFD